MVVLTLQQTSDFWEGTLEPAVVTLFDTDGPAPVVPDDGSGCGCGGDSAVGMAGGVGANPAGDLTAGDVHAFDGSVMVSAGDLDSAGFGSPWGQTRSWTNGAGYASASRNGSGQVVSELPTLRQDSAGTVALVSGGRTARYFNLDGNGGYSPESR